MKFRLLLALLLALFPVALRAHVGSPDVFFAGQAGPYPVQVTVRVPPVVPGRARIEVRPQTQSAVSVAVLPLYSKTAVKNAPPAEPAKPVPGAPGTYAGDLWLMSVGGYSIDVSVRGPEGEGRIQVPVNAVATHQLPLPPLMGKLLVALGGLLCFGAVAIVYAAAGESTLLPGTMSEPRSRAKARAASVVTAIVLAVMLVGGWKWWAASEDQFRRTLREGAWPDLSAKVEGGGDSQRILHLTLGEKAFRPSQALPLLPDHGKLLHAFLIREPARDAFAHVHPIRTGGKTFDLALPPLPEGDYRLLCDCTLGETGLSTTASTTVHLPPPPAAAGAPKLQPDADDSWAEAAPGESSVSLPGGAHALWLPHPALHARSDAHLQFRFTDAAGAPLALEPYMGMLSHAAVSRDDGGVFSHLHPTGNFSMAAQNYFIGKIAHEAAEGQPAEMDHSQMDHSLMGHATSSGDGVITLPYEFPSPGDYHLWVQVKTNGQVLTASFRLQVAP